MENVIGAVLLIGIVVSCFAIISPTVLDMVTSYTEVIKAHVDSMKRFTNYLNSLEFGNDIVYKTANETKDNHTGTNISNFPPDIKFQHNKESGEWDMFIYDYNKLLWVEVEYNKLIGGIE